MNSNTTRLSKPNAFDLDEVKAATEIERRWYKNWPTYRHGVDIREAVKGGALVYIGASGNVLPIQRLRNPETENWSYLGRLAAKRCMEMASRWRGELDEQKLDPERRLRLSLTSLVRTEQQQQRLISGGALAVEGSSHCNGAAWDISASCYYRYDDNGDLQSVHHPDRPVELIHQIGSELRQSTGDKPDSSPYRRPDLFDPRITDALLDVADGMMAGGTINAVVEFADTYNQCLHSAANPNPPSLA